MIAGANIRAQMPRGDLPAGSLPEDSAVDGALPRGPAEEQELRSSAAAQSADAGPSGQRGGQMGSPERAELGTPEQRTPARPQQSSPEEPVLPSEPSL